MKILYMNDLKIKIADKTKENMIIRNVIIGKGLSERCDDEILKGIDLIIPKIGIDMV